MILKPSEQLVAPLTPHADNENIALTNAMRVTDQASGVFISYRREDVPAHAGRLYDRLADQFGQSRVFMDVDSIDVGLDFLTVLGRAVESCDVMLVIIGPRWVSARARSGERRLDDHHDYVRMEIQAALAGSIRVVPVLVGGASLPSEVELPEPIRPLLRRQAYEIDDVSFQSDASRLIERLERVLTPSVRASAAPPSPAGSERPWQATCQAKMWSRSLDVTLSQSSHTIEYENRPIRANEVRLNGNVVGTTPGYKVGMNENYEFTVPDGPDARRAIVEVRLGLYTIKQVALTVDGRELYRGY